MDYQTSPVTLPKKLTSRTNPKTIYDGVFSSSKPPPLSSSPSVCTAVDDYRDIFLGSNADASSIPFLDVPELNTKAVDFKMSKNKNKNKSSVDYQNVFAGFGDFDGALSYQDIAAAQAQAQPKRKKHSTSAFVSMELEPMNTAPTVSQMKGSGHPDGLGGIQMNARTESYQSYVGTKQFNMPYRKTSPGLSNGVNSTHIAELNAVSGYTYIVDEGSRKTATKGDRPVSSDAGNACNESDSIRQMGSCSFLRKDTPNPPCVADAKEVPSGRSVKLQNKSSQDSSFSNGSLSDGYEIKPKEDLPKESHSNLQPNVGTATDDFKKDLPKGSLSDGYEIKRKEDLPKESHSNLQPSVGTATGDFKKSTIPKQVMQKTSGCEKTKGSLSPPDFDEEMDKSSVAAASAAAVKLAIEKAQARIKFAKESKEKKVRLQSFVKPSSRDGFRSDERKDTRVTNRGNKSSENNSREIYGKVDSWVQSFPGMGKQKVRQVGPLDDSLNVPDMERPTRETPVHKIRSIPVEHRQCSAEEQKAQKLPENLNMSFEQANNTEQMAQPSNESIRKEEKMTEKPVEYGKSSNLGAQVCTDEKKPEREENVLDKTVDPEFSDSLKVPVKKPTREEALEQRIRSMPVEHIRCSSEVQEADELSELSTARFEQADYATGTMQSSDGSIRKEAEVTQQPIEKPVDYDNKLANKVCTDEKAESEQNVFYNAEGHEVQLEFAAEQEKTAEKPPDKSPEEERLENIVMINQTIEIERKNEHQEVKEVKHTKVLEEQDQIETKKGKEVAFEQIEMDNHLDSVTNEEGSDIIVKETCGLIEITEGPYHRKPETPLVFKEEEGENNSTDARWNGDVMEKLDLVQGEQIMVGKYDDLHDLEKIENIKPAGDREFREDKTLGEEKESGSMILHICQLKENKKTETATQRLSETHGEQANVDSNSGDEATQKSRRDKCKQDCGENSSEVQAAAQSEFEADGIQVDVDLRPGDEATQEVCSEQQSKQERDGNKCKQDHGENFSEIQDSFMPTEISECVQINSEVLTHEINGKVMEVSETSDNPMVKKIELKRAEQREEELECKRASFTYSGTEINDIKGQMDGAFETELSHKQREQCKEDSVVSNLGCELSKGNGSGEGAQVSFIDEEASFCEQRSVDDGQCTEAAQLNSTSKENLEATNTNEEINFGEIEEKMMENDKILEEKVDPSLKEMGFEKCPTEKDEAKKMEREKERQRIAVERAMREARERAFAEAKRKMSEARDRHEKPPPGTNERSSADKATTEAKLKAERAAVERATAEARERALKKALSEKAGMGVRKQANLNDMRRTFSSTDSQHNGSVPSSSSRYPDPSNNGVPSSSERLDGVNVESAQRCKARLERHQRTTERAAKALAEKNMRDLLAQKEQQERNKLAEALDADIKRWSSGKEKNLRALLSTLQYILGPDSNWQSISLTELVTSAAVKKAYRKATLVVHPDKLQQRGASIQQKYICEKVFDLLKEAWNRFSAEER